MTKHMHTDARKAIPAGIAQVAGVSCPAGVSTPALSSVGVSAESFGALKTFEAVLPNGTKVLGVPVTLLDDRVLEKVHPRPTPPMKRPPGTGSSHMLKPDPDDPEFELAFGKWFDQDRLIKVAISLRYIIQDLGNWHQILGDEEQLKRWISDVIEELEPKVSVVWIRSYMLNLEKQSLGIMVDEAGRGNSSTPSTMS